MNLREQVDLDFAREHRRASDGRGGQRRTVLGIRWDFFAESGARWKAVDRAEELPPVSLYKVGNSYFVLDGNHRVSVAHYHGAEWVDAEVTEFRVPPAGGRKGREVHGELPRDIPEK